MVAQGPCKPSIICATPSRLRRTGLVSCSHSHTTRCMGGQVVYPLEMACSMLGETSKVRVVWCVHMHSQAYYSRSSCSYCTHRSVAGLKPFRCTIPGVKELHLQLSLHRQLRSQLACKTCKRRVRTGRLNNGTAKQCRADHTRTGHAGDTSPGVFQIVNETQSLFDESRLRHIYEC